HAAAGGFGPSAVRGIQQFHMDSRGMSDVAYNWLADDTYVYVGRGAGIAGGHTAGHNRDHAVCALGDWTTRVPPSALLDRLAEAAVLAWQAGAVTKPAYTHGHRDLVATSCPGLLQQLIPDINARA